MAGENLAFRIVEGLGAEAEPALGDFLSSLGRADWASARAALADPFKSAGSVFSHESLTDDYAMEKLQPLFLHENTVVADQSVSSIQESLARADSTPFKVLTADGASPGAHGVKWSLPTLREDGSWQAGEWLHMNNVPENSYRFPFVQATRQGLHVSNVPGKWALGNRGVRVFEAELGESDLMRWKSLLEPAKKFNPFSSSIGDRFSLSGPMNDFSGSKFGVIPPSRDFPAEEVRLKREIFGDELKAIISR